MKRSCLLIIVVSIFMLSACTGRPVFEKYLPINLEHLCSIENKEGNQIGTTGFLVSNGGNNCELYKGKQYCALEVREKAEDEKRSIIVFVQVGSGPNSMDMPTPRSKHETLVVRSNRNRVIDMDKDLNIIGDRENYRDAPREFDSNQRRFIPDRSCRLRVNKLVQYTQEDYDYWDKINKESLEGKE